MHPVITGILVGLALALCLVCSLGMLISRDPLQRLQFTTPIASVAFVLIAAAVWVSDSQWQARTKAALIAFLMIGSNAVVSHATARAIHIRETGGFEGVDDDSASSDGGEDRP